jgi:hypothetical protein
VPVGGAFITSRISSQDRATYSDSSSKKLLPKVIRIKTEIPV